MQELASDLQNYAQCNDLDEISSGVEKLLACFSEQQLQHALSTLTIALQQPSPHGQSPVRMQGIKMLSDGILATLVTKATSRMFDNFDSAVNDKRRRLGRGLNLEDMEPEVIGLSVGLMTFLDDFKDSPENRETLFAARFTTSSASKFEFADSVVSDPLIAAAPGKKLFFLSPNLRDNGLPRGDSSQFASNILLNAFQQAKKCIKNTRTVAYR